MSGLEIERKFLLYPLKVECFLKINGFKYKKLEIEQFYVERDRKIGRIRKVNDKYFLTLKKGEGMVREEHESEIDQSVFKNILSKDKPVGAIRKNRYVVEIDGFEYEIDEFLGDLDGLLMLEVEFESEQEANKFKVNGVFEPFVIEEVTSNPDFLNETIAKTSFAGGISCTDLYKSVGVQKKNE